jgi:hypothetical protein
MYEFLEWCFEQPERVIFAHFGGIYDFLFILKAALEESDCGYKIGTMIPRGSGLLCIEVIKLRKNPQGQVYEDKIMFRDSSALLPFGLARLTESFKVQHKKQEFDFSNWDGTVTPKLLSYLKDDCRGLYECLEAFFNWELIQRSGGAYTMASQALKVFRLFMYKEIRSLKEPIDLFIRQAYFGGRTEIFKPEYHGKKKLYCYDVNSLYPFVMRNNDFPTNFKRWTLTYDPEAMGFYEATVEVPKDMYLPPLPYVAEMERSKKLIFPTGKFSGVWSTIELEYARSLGVKILSTGRGALFHNGGPIFKGYIDTLYEMRMDAKAKGDGVGDVLTKLLMNSLYGRFGLNTDREQILFDDFTKGLKFHSEINIEKDGKEKCYRLMTKPVKLEQTFTNVSISAWVTSLSRIHMHKLMWPARKELYYTDTDSLFTTKKMKTGNKLGELKEEYSCNKAIFLLPKTYVVEGEGDFKKLAMKGFDRRKINNFTYKDFYTALEGDLRHMRVTHDEKFAKFKTAAKKGNLTTLLPEQDKAIRSLYDKRKIMKKGRKWDTQPLHI